MLCLTSIPLERLRMCCLTPFAVFQSRKYLKVQQQQEERVSELPTHCTQEGSAAAPVWGKQPDRRAPWMIVFLTLSAK